MTKPRGSRAKIECPVSASRLEEMYWVEGKNLSSIATDLHERGLINSVVSWGTVRRWFSDSGIPVANRHQNFRRGLKTKTAKYGSVAAILKGRTWTLSDEQRRRLSVIKKGKKLGTQTPEQLGHPQLRCAHCDQLFRRCVSGIRQALRRSDSPFLYCSHECRVAGPRFTDTIQAETIYFNSDWYLRALSSARAGATRTEASA